MVLQSTYRVVSNELNLTLLAQSLPTVAYDDIECIYFSFNPVISMQTRLITNHVNKLSDLSSEHTSVPGQKGSTSI